MLREVRRLESSLQQDSASEGVVRELGELARLSSGAFQSWWSPAVPGTTLGPAPVRPGVKGRLADSHLRAGRVINEVMSWISHEQSGAVKPFELSVEVLAVDSPLVLARETGYALIASCLLDAPDSWRTLLRELISELA